MPVENEVFWVLDPKAEWRRISTSITSVVEKRLRQGYLSREARIRETLVGGSKSHLFTFKRPVADELVEIETAISDDDFKLLWPQTSNRSSKTRYSFDNDAAHWDLDVFEDENGDAYFAKLEAERPRGVTSVPRLPTPFVPFLLHYAGSDPRFSAHALSDRRYAVTLLDEVSNSTHRTR